MDATDHQEAGQGKGSFVKGLKQLFGNQVAIFTLDPESTRRRNVQADYEVEIFTDQITVEDIAPLQDELRLNPTAIEAAYLIVAKYGKNWGLKSKRTDASLPFPTNMISRRYLCTCSPARR